jgi:hypothetical protein
MWFYFSNFVQNLDFWSMSNNLILDKLEGIKLLLMLQKSKIWTKLEK